MDKKGLKTLKHLKIKLEIIFFTFENTDQNAKKNNLSVIIKHFIRKLLSKLILDCGKDPNQKTCTFTFMPLMFI